jgi:hypothetical protein
MADTTRLSQLVAEVVSTGSPQTRLSQLVVEIIESASPAPITPAASTLYITGLTSDIIKPVIPSSKALSVTGLTSDVGVYITIYPGAAALSATGLSAVVVPPIVADAGTAVITGLVAVIDSSIFADLVIDLPAVVSSIVAEDDTVLVANLPSLIVAFDARGVNASLIDTFPSITFSGETSAPSWMAVTLPSLESGLFGGTGFVTELPFPEIVFSAVIGSTCTLDANLTSFIFSSQSGALLSSATQSLEVLFSGTTGTVGRMLVDLPPFAALFEADVQGLAQLVINLPSLQSAFTTDQEIISALVAEFPALSALFSAPVGVTSSLGVSLPALSALLTSYEDITGQLVVVLPALRTLMEAAQTGRFDSETIAQLDGMILKWRRPQ